MKRLPPIEKIYEAYSAIADGRIKITEQTDSSTTAEVTSSDRTKTYTVRAAGDTYASTDSATVWQHYAGYPIIALLMLQGRLPLNLDIAKQLSDVNWTAFNKAHKRDYAAAVASIIAERHLDPAPIEAEVQSVYSALQLLPLTIQRLR